MPTAPPLEPLSDFGHQTAMIEFIEMVGTYGPSQPYSHLPAWVRPTTGQTEWTKERNERKVEQHRTWKNSNVRSPGKGYITCVQSIP